MSSSHRDTTDRQCVGKRTYRRKADAKSAARWAQAHFKGSALHAYRCGRCDLFHVGHKAAFQPKEETNAVQEEVGTIDAATDDHGERAESAPPVIESAEGKHTDRQSVGEPATRCP